MPATDRRQFACLALFAALSAGTAQAAGATPPYVAAAVASADRGVERGADARRKVAEVTTFAGVKPGDKVLELIPGSGYFTHVFSKVVGPKGHVYAVWPEPYAREAVPDVKRLDAQSKTPTWGNITVLIQPAPQLTAPEPLDVVFTSQNYHDYPDKFMGKLHPSVFNKAVFKALKSGGTFIVIDHAAERGSGMRDTDTRHRIDPAIVRKQVVEAGFVFVDEYDGLRNKADDHTLTVFDKAIRGKTDQFAFKFRKP
jgi:predicted methyltransferase